MDENGLKNRDIAKIYGYGGKIHRQIGNQINFASSGTKYFVIILDKNAENAIFGTHDDDTSIPGEI